MYTPTYISSTKFTDIIPTLQQMAVRAAHFTNGTYAFDPKLIVPTTLAGFKHVTNTYSKLPLVIAVNSDISMAAMKKTGFEDQKTRAQKVAVPLQQLFPNNQVIVVYYDEETPFKLYQTLSKYNLTRTLHKWGYGTEPSAPVIKGAEFFESVYGFPLPNDKKPLCFDISERSETEQSNVIVEDLREKLINKDNKLLFKLPKKLKQYGQPQNQKQTCCTIL